MSLRPLPAITWNGTDVHTLFAQEERILDGIRALRALLVECRPNARDYREHGGIAGTFNLADYAYVSELRTLERMTAEHTRLAEHCLDHICLRQEAAERAAHHAHMQVIETMAGDAS